MSMAFLVAGLLAATAFICAHLVTKDDWSTNKYRIRSNIRKVLQDEKRLYELTLAGISSGLTAKAAIDRAQLTMEQLELNKEN